MNLFSRVVNFVNISILIYRRRANVCANPVGGIRSVCYLNGDKMIRHKGLCNGLGGSPASHRGDLSSKTVQSMWDLWCIIWYCGVQWGMLQRTMLQQTRRNTIDRRSTRVRMTCRAFPLWLECQSSSLLSIVTFSYQFSSVSCCFRL